MSSQRTPYEIIERMLERMNSQFDETGQMWDTGGSGIGRMGIDVADRGDAFVVTADLPGFEREDIDLRVVDDTLHVSAQREQASEEEAGTYLRSEREHRSLSERVRLPDSVLAEDVEATLQNGVLTVTLPKAEPASGGTHIDIA